MPLQVRGSALNAPICRRADFHTRRYARRGAPGVIHVRGLAKFFSGRPALRGVDLDLAPGERLALIGPNGSGKTTLLRILATLSMPSAGNVRIAGHEIGRRDPEIRRLVGLLSHQPLLYDDLSGYENLRFYAEMYDVENPNGRIAALLEQVGLVDQQNERVRTYSRGMKQRLALARALLHNPPVLLLDEPYTGLDSRATEMLDAVLCTAGRGGYKSSDRRTVLMTTHDLAKGWQVAPRLAFLIDGRIAFEVETVGDDLEAVRKMYKSMSGE
jgi:heme exporter protein A